MLLHHNNAKNHYELYGRAYADPENFSWGGERVEGIFMFPGGGLRHIFDLRNLGFFRPLPDSPLKISAWESNFKCKPK